MSEAKPIALIVDDTPANLDLLTDILRDHCKVKVAISGPKALEVAGREPLPDIILLDVSMPGMSGYEVCRKLKEDPATSAIPILFVTARAEAEDEQRGLALGAVDYITKPFHPASVEARVRTQLSIYRESRKLVLENSRLKERVVGAFRNFSEQELLEMIREGESGRLEFKSTLRWNLHTNKNDKRIENQCLKTVAAYLNSDGGVLMVGISDEGEPLGLEHDHFPNEDRLLLHWVNLIRTYLGGEFTRFIRSTPYDLEGRRALVIECLPSTKPVFVDRDNEESFFVRMENTTQALKPSALLAYYGERFGDGPD